MRFQRPKRIIWPGAKNREHNLRFGGLGDDAPAVGAVRENERRGPNGGQARVRQGDFE